MWRNLVRKLQNSECFIDGSDGVTPSTPSIKGLSTPKKRGPKRKADVENPVSDEELKDTPAKKKPTPKRVRKTPKKEDAPKKEESPSPTAVKDEPEASEGFAKTPALFEDDEGDFMIPAELRKECPEF